VLLGQLRPWRPSWLGWSTGGKLPSWDFKLSKLLRLKNVLVSGEGAIRIPLPTSSFLFSDLVFLYIPRKSLKFLTLLFSMPTAPTKFR
jgi:hypothetical protein